eukprot:TRINITY_DN307_c0_g1_i5.p2 TRINITY_DN307_c0_g1~~TRINITY_DN307_c0_g1_i5.p2  ORF type:complete len:567 (+),score=241.54 TRINITY_DN307_c0_g1_i5:50-1702(+)
MMQSMLLLCSASMVLANTQVHTALGMTDDTLSVAWVSTSSKGDSEVHWGLSPNALTNNATGDMRHFRADILRSWQTRTAIMSNLVVGQTYYYKVGDSHNGYSEVFKVRNRRAPGTGPYYHVLFGDMGAKAAFTLCSACTKSDRVCDANTCSKNTSVGLVSEVDKADMFLHVGDFAYNLGTDNGKTGDQFMENIEQVAARVPYMVSHGNHEDAPEALAHYIERFRSQPVNSEPSKYLTINGEGPNTMYFSWNFGMVHYISFSTELFHAPVEEYSLTVTKHTFLKWVEEDLKKANLPENRAKYPWILVHGHRPLYSSSTTDASDTKVRAALEPLFFKYGVSFSVNGHEHNYERSWPTYQDKSDQSYNNPNATIYIVSGAAGSIEMHTPFKEDQPSWCAYRSNTFGYTRFLVSNSTHLHIQQVQTDPSKFPLADYGRVIDDVWIVQHNQGPFSRADVPKSVPTSCPATLCKSVDHFAPILLPRLGVTDMSTPLHTAIQEYKKTHGDLAWGRQLQQLLRFMNRGNTTGNVEWEDGLLDEKEQGALRWLSQGDSQ